MYINLTGFCSQRVSENALHFQFGEKFPFISDLDSVLWSPRTTDCSFGTCWCSTITFTFSTTFQPNKQICSCQTTNTKEVYEELLQTCITETEQHANLKLFIIMSKSKTSTCSLEGKQNLFITQLFLWKTILWVWLKIDDRKAIFEPNVLLCDVNCMGELHGCQDGMFSVDRVFAEKYWYFM